MKSISIFPLITAAILFSGCGTIGTKSKGHWGEAYTGTKCSATMTAMAATSGFPGEFMVPLLAIDTAVSAVFDTLLLPIDWPLKARKANGVSCRVIE